ncbi:uncharacterized protein BJ212DRAFT_1485640 [Suillus subaureus]|uniref:Uncharacterized protein n=1 Tax=Suillus subaureus TaxID=48587 RepID=A0A9P7DZZ6_9AGAM|nr:uncharacterized protein BJ212DRAFT_1485640 [Suillus subaureus]KAG1807527.1 hypothetical protein BJ212DRAFT_1485640 [Suillus subaureus]
MSSATPAAAPKMTFTTVAASLSEEANCIQGEQKLNGSRSEYANVIGAGIPESWVNSKTGIHMHKSNPKGIACDNPACVGLPQSLTHDREHCFQPGGGMEGKGRVPAHSRKPFRKDVAAAATTDTPVNPSSTFSPSISNADLACTIIKEIDDPSDSSPTTENIACIVCQAMSMILDSGTTSTLITDCKFFWNFSNDSHVVVKMANHGQLPISGQGDCVADLNIGGKIHRI